MNELPCSDLIAHIFEKRKLAMKRTLTVNAITARCLTCPIRISGATEGFKRHDDLCNLTDGAVDRGASFERKGSHNVVYNPGDTDNALDNIP